MLWAGLVAQVSATLSSAGMPGAELIQQMLNLLSQLALWGSLASIFIGCRRVRHLTERGQLRRRWRPLVTWFQWHHSVTGTMA